jgi:phosphate transport system protein
MGTLLEKYIADIGKRLEKMQELCGKALLLAMDAFASIDVSLALEVAEMADENEELSHKVEENVIETIARRQPVAGDLRKLAGYLQVAGNLYRIGRHANKIAHIVKLADGLHLQHFKELRTLPFLAQQSKRTLDIAMKAVLIGDLSEMEELEKLESVTDKETEDMFEEIVEYLRKDQTIVRMALFYILVGRYYERAADHAMMIAERAIYTVTGHRQKLGLAYKEASLHPPH